MEPGPKSTSVGNLPDISPPPVNPDQQQSPQADLDLVPDTTPPPPLLEQKQEPGQSTPDDSQPAEPDENLYFNQPDEFQDPGEVQTLYAAPNYQQDYEPEPLEDEEEQDFDQWVQETLAEGNPDYSSIHEYYANMPQDKEKDQAIPEESESESIPEEIDYSFPTPKPPGKLMGMKSFRYLESRILANFIKDSEDERMEKIKARLGFMKEVDPPEDTSLSILHEKAEFAERPSKEGLVEPLKDYTLKEWALKHAVSFLQKAGCRSPEESWTEFKIAENDKSPRLKVFLQKGGVGGRRRLGIPDGAPELDVPTIRRAERAVKRYILNTSLPKYPLPRFILPKFQNRRKAEKELLGPGSYDLDYYEQQRLKKLRTMPSLWRSCSSRFPKEGKKIDIPASAFITDPYFVWDAACDRMRHPGTVPLFQSTPCNFRYKDFYVGCGLPPGHYNVKSPMEEFLNTKKSLRGMYDRGSGTDAFCPKDCREYSKSISLNQTFKTQLGPGSYNIRQSVTQELGDKYNFFKAKFSKTRRNKMLGFRAAYDKPLWPEDKGFPGPATYEPFETEEWTEPSWVPFNVAVKGRKMANDSDNKLTAPDFYFYNDTTIPVKKNIIGDGMRSNFLSKSPMTAPQSMHVVMKERNKASNKKFDQEHMHKEKALGPCE